MSKAWTDGLRDSAGQFVSKLYAERYSPHESDINIRDLSLMSIILSLSVAHSEEVKCTGKLLGYHTMSGIRYLDPFSHPDNFCWLKISCLYRH